MKKLFLLTVLLPGLLSAYSQAVSLDPSFAGKGWTFTDFEKGNHYMEMGQQVLLQKDGSFIIVIQLESRYLILARYLPDGTLDNSFGTDGYSEPAYMSSSGGLQAKAALQSDGKIIVAGGHRNDGSLDIMLSRYNTNGTRDKSFGEEGVIRTDLGGNDFTFSLAVQSDDRIVVAGTTDDYNTGRSYLYLVRYTSDGTLDASFDGDGKLITAKEDYEWSDFMALQNDGKIVVCRIVYDPNAGSYSVILTRYNPDGSPDAGFDEDGTLVTDFFNGGEVTALAVQNDGKIVLAGGATLNAENSDFALKRYNADGSVDNGFGDEGTLTTDFGGYDYASSLAVQGDGKIVVAGLHGFNSDTFVFALARYQEDGTPDLSFDGDGKLTTAFEDLAAAYSLAVQSDGKIVVAGVAAQMETITIDYALARYNADGSLDSGFDSDGKLTGYYPAGLSEINCLAVQSDGKIIVAGGSGNPFMRLLGTETVSRNYTAVAAALPPQRGTDIGLARYKADGSLDPSFGANGKLVLDLGGSEEATSLVVQADGKILMAGMSVDTEGYLPLLFLARINAEGTLDSSFDGDGKLVTGFFNIGEEQALVLQQDGKIVVAATVLDPETGNSDFAIARYNPDGSLDNSFNGNGRSVADFGSPAAAVLSLAVQDDGKIVANGVVADPNTNNIDFALARYHTDGSLDHSFDGDGKLTTDFENGLDYATSVAIQADGKIVVAGFSNNANYEVLYIALSRYNPNGSLDSSFDGDGKLTSDLFEQEDYNILGLTPSLALQSNGKIVVAGTTATYDSGNSDLDFALARYNSDGTLDSSFGDKGKLIQDFEQVDDMATSLLISRDRLYVVGNSTAVIQRGVLATYHLDCMDREVCGNRVDDNCDGQVDEGCPATPFLTINDVTVSEDLKRATLMVTLSKKMDVPVSFSYFTQDRTAVSKPNKGARDFEAESGTLTIAAGQQTAVISINILDDNLTEGEEYFDVHLQRPVNAAMAGDKGRVTILDGQPSVGIFLTDRAAGIEEDKELASVQKLSVKAQPNPSAGAFTLVLQSDSNTPVVLKVTDAAGRLVEAKAGLAPNTTLKVGQNYRPGVYYAEVVQGRERVSLKLVKQ